MALNSRAASVILDVCDMIVQLLVFNLIVSVGDSKERGAGRVGAEIIDEFSRPRALTVAGIATLNKADYELIRICLGEYHSESGICLGA